MVTVLRRARARLLRRAEAARARYPWLGHARRAGRRYLVQRGNHFAAAVTFFSLVAAVPLLMIAFGAAGYVLASEPALLAGLQRAVTEAVPSAAEEVTLPLVRAAVEQRDSVAGLGVLGAVWAGIWWMSGLREAVSAQWRLPPLPQVSPRRVLLDLVALVGLAAALLCSVAGSVLAAGLVEDLVDTVGLGGWWARALLAATGTLLGVGAKWVVLLWILARLPREPLPWRDVAGAALVGAVGIGVLEVFLATFLGATGETPGGAVFGSLLGVLLFVYVVSRFVLLLTAWTATADPEEAPDEPAPAVPDLPAARPPAGVLAALLSGVLVGMGLRRGRGE